MLDKRIKDLKVAILVPCYKRPEYTEMCIRALEKVEEPCQVDWYLWDDGSRDGTDKILASFKKQNRALCISEENEGLRQVIRHFLFDPCSILPIDIIAKIDNDCVVPPDYLKTMLKKLASTDADILSPNVLPSNASYKYGQDDTENLGYRPSKIVGGLWLMKRAMIQGIDIEKHDVVGIKGAVNIIYQIVVEKEPKIGWVTECTVQDIGHWSGVHPEHIKSAEHLRYYHEIGRQVAWGL